jgi:aminopeptidase YwaD
MARGLAFAAAMLLVLSSSCGGTSRPGKAPSEQSLLAMVRQVSGSCPKRFAGSRGEARAARILAGRFRDAGLEPIVTTFPLLCFRDDGAHLELEGGKRLAVSAFVYSPSLDMERDTLPLVAPVPGDDLSAARGAILVLGHGAATAREVALEASAAGAAAIVFVDPRRPTLQRVAAPGCPLPMVELGGTEASALLAFVAGRDMPRGRLVVRTSTYSGTSTNVAAVLHGGGTAGKVPVIIVGAHLDSVGTPGAADNASGLACLAGLAQLLSSRPVAADIWFVGFGAEEMGELGSANFLSRWEGPPIAAMFAIDTVGSGGTTMAYSLHGSRNAAVNATVAAGQGLGMRVEAGSSDSSDHLPFALAGIPAAFVMRLPEERRHTAGDRAGFIDGHALAGTVLLVEAAIRELAAAQALR